MKGKGVLSYDYPWVGIHNTRKGITMKMAHLWDPYSEFKQYTLSNGLEVYHSHWDKPWLKVGFMVHSGSFADGIGKWGTAHFVEHMLSKNIDGYPRKKAEMFFNRSGGSAMFGRTGRFSTTYGFAVPARVETFQEGLGIFGNMLMEGEFKRFLERERKVILCEFKGRFPMEIDYEVYELRKNRVLYEGRGIQGYVHGLGNPETISAISEDDLLHFYREHYVPQNISVVVVGGLSTDVVLECLSRSALAKKIKGVRRLLPQKMDIIPKPGENEYVFDFSKLLNSSVTVGTYNSYVALPGNLKSKTLSLFVRMARHILDDEVRQKLGATYHIDVGFANHIQTKEVHIGGRVNPHVLKDMQELVAGAMQRLKTEKRLFHDIRSARLNWYAMLDMNGGDVLDTAMDDLEVNHRIILIREEIAGIRKVAFVDVCALADHIADPGNRWTVFGHP